MKKEDKKAASRAVHENYGREDPVRAGSERSFGIVFAVVFAAVAFWPLMEGAPVSLWALAVGGTFLAAGLWAPVVLRPLNRIWFLFGLALNKIMNPLVMGLLFYLTIAPTGLIMRLVGKDPLHRRFDPQAKSYWIERRPPGPEPDTMRFQF